MSHQNAKTELTKDLRAMARILEAEGVIKQADRFIDRLRLTVSTNARRCASNGGIGVSRGRHVPKISMAIEPLRRMAELDGKVPEYKSFQHDPEIGAVRTNSKGHAIRMILAHELAHAVQFTVGQRGSPQLRFEFQGPNAADRLPLGDRRPHGELFRSIYRILRRQYVNPRHPEAEAARNGVDLAAFPRVKTQREDPAPKTAPKKRAAKKAAPKPTTEGGYKNRAQLVRTMIENGEANDAIIEAARRDFPNVKTGTKEVNWYRWQLRKAAE